MNRRGRYNSKSKYSKNNTQPQQRYSYGIVCFDSNNRVLCVRKAFTYAMTSLITGTHADNDYSIQQLFNELTSDERKLIKNSNYEVLLNLVFYEGGGNIIPEAKQAMTQKFKERWSSQKIIDKLQNCSGTPESLLWEIPKGHYDRRTDSNMQETAIREFIEETRIPRESFDIIQIPPYKDSHTDAGVTYVVQYWFAVIKDDDHKLSIDYSAGSYHSLEVSGIKWMLPEEVKYEQSKKYCETSTRLFKAIVKHYKKSSHHLDSGGTYEKHDITPATVGVRRRSTLRPYHMDLYNP